MFKKVLVLIVVCFLFFSCSKQPQRVSEILSDTPKIKGKQEYLNSPYVTAGNRVYIVGHQDGSFPELGWHIKGEMGGIWNHPIKLMDGFDVHLNWGNNSFVLNKATSFTNYPFANKHDFKIEEKSLRIERWQFVPDDTEGIAIEFVIFNEGNTAQNFNFVFTGHSDLRPTWLGERTEMINSQDESTYKKEINGWLVKDKNNPWFVSYSGSEKPKQEFKANLNREALTVSNTLNYPIKLNSGEYKVLTFSIAGSYKSEEAAISTLKEIQTNLPALVHTKKERYKGLANQSKLTIPDKELERTFEWLKYNCDWLIREVPEIGSGITAGIPDYPWWFGVDSEYALQGYMAVGQQEAVYNTIKLLDSVSEAINGNGKIIHEMSTNGAVFNPGNINETPQFASLIWEVYKWNGDKAFLKNYYPTIKKGLKWLIDENDLDKNGFPEGFGMMEIHGLDSEMIDVASYTQKAFADASKIAKELGEHKTAKEYAEKARLLKVKINEEFWSEDFNSYADFIGSDKQTLHLIDDAIVRADTLNKPWAIKEMEETRQFILDNPSTKPRPFVLHHNWVVNTPMEMGIADSVKAIKALETAKNYVNPFGVFVTGIDRDESAGSDAGAYKAPPIFTYTGAVMTLPTGVSARAENNYGRPNEALNYLERMTRSFSYALPGSMYEVSPDFGMMTQAWNIYSFAYPIVNQFFGIQPNAAKKEIIISPQMPDKWDKASLENVKIGENEISIYYSKESDKLNLKINQTNSNWSIKLKTPKNLRYKSEAITTIGKRSEKINDYLIESDDEGINVTFYFIEKD
ncbi:glycogen debranching protein [uncultured Croceitalea sp.]|uniref:amylo-alpha-1,6-glucosidase n=1 Tax=uncultured Croceitalea sp. TaxID=1798908 RepID=UPI003306291C